MRHNTYKIINKAQKIYQRIYVLFIRVDQLADEDIGRAQLTGRDNVLYMIIPVAERREAKDDQEALARVDRQQVLLDPLLVLLRRDGEPRPHAVEGAQADQRGELLGLVVGLGVRAPGLGLQ